MRNIFITLLPALIILSSCSDWTEAESKGYHRQTPAEADPEGYKNYLAALREFKKAEHPVSMITVMAAENPTHQNQHLMSLPDSVDYICLKGVTTLGAAAVEQIKQVREQKGTKVLCVIDYGAIVDSWDALWTGTPDDPDAEDDRTPDEFGEYCTAQTDLQLSKFDQYDFDGIHISYLGNRNGEKAQKGQDTYMSRIIAWQASHSGVTTVFRGDWANLAATYRPITEDCLYLVATPFDIVSVATGMDGYVQRQLRYLEADATSDVRNRIVYEVAIPDIDNPQQIGVTLEVAAKWTLLPLAANTPDNNKFSKKGIAIDNAQDDYFNVSLIYSNIREAIGLMNPDGGEEEE